MKKYYVGVDLHKRYTTLTAINQEGEVVMYEKEIPNSSTEILISKLLSIGEPQELLVAFESCSNWYWLDELLSQHSIEHVMSHPKITKYISAAKQKTDKVASLRLAKLLRTSMLPTAYILPAHLRCLRDIARHRIILTKIQTSVKNRLHAVLRNFNLIFPYSDLFSLKGSLWLDNAIKYLPTHYQFTVKNYIKLVNLLEQQIQQTTYKIHLEMHNHPQVLLLLEIPGIDVFLAVVIILEIGDIRRFPSSKHLCSFCGVVPTVRQSGEISYTGHLSYDCNMYLKWAITQAAVQVKRIKEHPFRSFYEKLESKKGTKKAIIAVARKIAVSIYHMLSKNQHFNPTINKETSAGYIG